MNDMALSPAVVSVSERPQARDSKRPLVGLLALADLRGALGFGLDDASWLTTAYSAGELIAMPFSAWFAVTFSVRRLELWVLAACTILAVMLPFVRDLELLLMLRFAQGV